MTQLDDRHEVQHNNYEADRDMSHHRHDALMENYEDLLAQGVSTLLALDRLGVTRNSLVTIYRRRGREFTEQPKPYEDMWTGFVNRARNGDTL